MISLIDTVGLFEPMGNPTNLIFGEINFQLRKAIEDAGDHQADGVARAALGVVIGIAPDNIAAGAIDFLLELPSVLKPRTVIALGAAELKHDMDADRRIEIDGGVPELVVFRAGKHTARGKGVQDDALETCF